MTADPPCRWCSGSGLVIVGAANGMRCRLPCVFCRWTEVQGWERRNRTVQRPGLAMQVSAVGSEGNG